MNILDYVDLNGGINGSAKQKTTYHANSWKTPLAITIGYTESIFVGTNNTTIKGIRALETWYTRKYGGKGFFEDIIVPEDTYDSGNWGVNYKAEFDFLKILSPVLGRLGGTRLPIPSFNLDGSKLKGYHEGAFTWEPEIIKYKNGRYLYGMSRKIKREYGGSMRILLNDFASPQKPWWKFATGMTNSFNNLNEFLKNTDSSERHLSLIPGKRKRCTLLKKGNILQKSRILMKSKPLLLITQKVYLKNTFAVNG